MRATAFLALLAVVVAAATHASASPPGPILADGSVSRDQFIFHGRNQGKPVQQQQASDVDIRQLAALVKAVHGKDLPLIPYVPIKEQVAAAIATKRNKARDAAMRKRLGYPRFVEIADANEGPLSWLDKALGAGPKTKKQLLPNPNAPVFDTKQAYKVTSLPELEIPSEWSLYAGHIVVDDLGSTEFFLYFEREEQQTRDLVVWLNGGPGASSLFGLFVENGAIAFEHPSGKPKLNHFGWHKAGNALFLENPAGVGFSTVNSDAGYPSTIHEVGEQFWRFSQGFTKLFGDFDWWITGESFGGMYVPHIADHIVKHNDKLAAGEAKISLKGIAVGNGVLYTPYDLPVNWFDDFEARGFLTSPSHKQELRQLRDACSNELADLKRFANRDVPSCFRFTGKFGNHTYIQEATEGKTCLPTMYDARVTACGAGDPTDPYNQHTKNYLNRPDVQRALHATVEPREWVWLSNDVHIRLYWNGDQPSYQVLPTLQARGVRILFYNGDADIICSAVGEENSFSHLRWGGAIGWGKHNNPRPYRPRLYANPTTKKRGRKLDTVGSYIQARGISYVRVYEASHMVPFNQPEASLAMLQEFMRGEL